MSATVLSVDTAHEDMIHDAQFDYYSRLLATASSDRSVRVFGVDESVYTLRTILTGHEGPVWQVAWAHPKFGSVLASCSYDGSVLVFREASPGQSWPQIYSHRGHDSSVNSISFAPHEFGLLLACASADGKVSILEHRSDDTWAAISFQDSPLGVNAVSWAPFASSTKRLVTGGCDNKIRLWTCGDSGWTEELLADTEHSDWVRDVAWAPSTGLPHDMIASASEDRTVRIWTRGSDGSWGSVLLHVFEAPVWRVSWSVTGNLLAVSSGDSDVTLWKQSVDGSWAQITSVQDDAMMAN